MTDPRIALAFVQASLSDDDIMYDHPVAMSGEPMDPVLYVRLDAIFDALPPDWRGYEAEIAILRAALDGLVIAARAVGDTIRYPEDFDAADALAILRAALAAAKDVSP
jgi:hypothetical protein